MTGINNSDKETDKSDAESYVGELTISELAAGLSETCLENEKLRSKVIEHRNVSALLQDEKDTLLSIIVDLEEDVRLLNLTQLMRRSSTGLPVKNEMPLSEEISKISAYYRSQAGVDKSSEDKKANQSKKQKMSKNVSQHLERYQKRYYGPQHKSLKCFHCDQFGHSKSSCYKLIGYPKRMLSHQGRHINIGTKTEKALPHDSCVETVSSDKNHVMYEKRFRSLKGEGKRNADAISKNLSKVKLVNSIKKKSENSEVVKGICHKIQSGKNCDITRTKVMMESSNVTVDDSIRKEDTPK